MDKKKVIGLAALGAGILFLVTRKKAAPVIVKSMTAVEFYKTYYPIALQDQKKTGVPALFTLAQAAIESAYGRAAPGFNFFGIKAGSSWKGKTQLLKTWESGKTGDPVKDHITDKVIQIFKPGEKGGIYKNAYSYRVYGKFKAYGSALESFNDHSAFLLQNKRYSEAFKKSDPKQFAEAIAKAGYATDPNYASTLTKQIDIVKKNVA
ncbi:MAG: glucosaminidase domain-containing protein [Bacteroidota bacterium]